MKIRAWDCGTVRDILILFGILLAFVLFTGRSVHSPMKSGAHDIDRSKSGLKMVIVVHRHGARTPLTALFWPDTAYTSCASHGRYESGPNIQLVDEREPNSILKPLDLGASLLPGGCRMGQLTKKGQEQGRELGRWLRSRYVNEFYFLPKRFEPSTIGFRSTLYERAILTLQGVINGMYPELTPRDKIRVNVTSEAFEIEYGKNVTCPKLGPIFAQLESLQEKADSADAGLASLSVRVRSDLLKAQSSRSTVNWIRLYDSIVAMEAEGNSWPDGLTSSLRSEIGEQALKHEAQVVNPVPGDGVTALHDHNLSKQVVRLSIGPLIHRVITNLLHESEEPDRDLTRKLGPKGEAVTQGPRMKVFSGHDSTLSPFLVALGKPFKSWPPFASSLVFELWQPRSTRKQVKAGKREAFVRVLFNREPLVVEGGSEGGWIGLVALENLLKPYSTDEAGKEDECKL